MLPGDLNCLLYPLLGSSAPVFSGSRVGTKHADNAQALYLASVSRSGLTPRAALGSWIAENPPKQLLCAAREKRYRRMSFPWALSPRFARYYRDSNGVEFRDLMKAYGIRFDVIVNGKVCGSSHPSAWWLLGQGGWRAPGDPAVHPALLICFCLTGRKIQHHPHSHQHWFRAGAHGCCEYLPCLAGFLGRGKSLPGRSMWIPGHKRPVRSQAQG